MEIDECRIMSVEELIEVHVGKFFSEVGSSFIFLIRFDDAKKSIRLENTQCNSMSIGICYG